MRATEICGCFPTGKHYPGIADRMRTGALAVQGLADGIDANVAWMNHTLVVLDFETTGLDAVSDRVIEVGAARFENGVLLERSNWLVNPGLEVSAETTEVTGITTEMLHGKPDLTAVWPEFLRTLTNAIPVAYNYTFDRGFLHAEIERLQLAHGREPACMPDVVWLDPLVWARETQQGEKGFRLTDVCARLSIELESAHRAGHDAEAAGHVLMALANKMPSRYADVIRVQSRLAATQEVDRTIYPRR